jgi:integrase
MKSAYWLFKRGKVFYAEDTRSGQQMSLKTSDRGEAERLIAAKNETAGKGQLALAVGQVYINSIDPALLTRTWNDVMEVMSQRGGENTQARTRRAMACSAFDCIRGRGIHETTGGDFLTVLKDKKRSTSHYLKLLQTMAINLGWLTGRVILPKQCWPRTTPRPKRAITWDEHQMIMQAEKNSERRLFYDTLWETGASQSDAANLCREDVDPTHGVLAYHRAKTGTQASIKIGARFKKILKQLPAKGSLFPKVSTLDSVARSAEFHRRCRLLGFKGVSLHSYRYAWAERAFAVGYPERFAQAALGHDSRAIHHAYARQARVVCPPLENYRGG